MIQLAPVIEPYASRVVQLDPRYRQVLVEVAADSDVDLAIVDEDQLRQFERSETGDDVAIDWQQRVRGFQNMFDFPDRGRHHLLIWNPYENRRAIVAYKITPME